MGNKTEVIGFFENRATDYLAKSGRGLWRRFREREAAAIFEMLKALPGQRLVDLGCGAGFYSLSLRDRFSLRVLGVDTSPAMLNALSRHGVETKNQSIENLDVGIGAFERALAAGVLEFVQHPEEFFQRCHQALTSDGRLVILVPPGGVIGLLYRLIHELKGCRVFRRSRHDYLLMASRAGFKLAESRRCTIISEAMAFEVMKQ